MTEMIIEKGIIIDDAESVLYGIRNLCGKSLSDLGVVKQFINQEKNTRFYLDSNLNSSMQQQDNCVYIWMDTGLTDYYGSPIFLSLLKTDDVFTGHVVGTIRSLSENARRFFKLNRSMVDKKTEMFGRKYAAKADERRIRHIQDERQYMLDSLNEFDKPSVFSEKLLAAGIIKDVTNETGKKEILSESNAAGSDSPPEKGLSKIEEEITIGLLLEKMDAMQKHMDQLLSELQKVSSESKSKISELQEKNEEYRRAILQMRNFVGVAEEEALVPELESKNIPGHVLLGKHGKILVIGGQELGKNVIHGIAKRMGFEKGDFDFIDYDKAKNYADRIRRDGKYSAVIIGSCPHKAAGNAGYTSTVEKLKSIEGMPFTTDARSKSGKLKVTKESFREALFGVCENLKLGYAC